MNWRTTTVAGYVVIMSAGCAEDGNIEVELPRWGLQAVKVECPDPMHCGDWRDAEMAAATVSHAPTLAAPEGGAVLRASALCYASPPDPRCVADDDGDGVSAYYDCDDANPWVNPFAPEVRCNEVDENCDSADDCDTDRDGVLDRDDCGPTDPSIGSECFVEPVPVSDAP